MTTTNTTTNTTHTQAAAQWAKVEVDVEAKVAKIMKEAAEEMKAAPVSLVAVLDSTLIQWVDLKGATHGFWDAFGQAMKEQGVWL